MRYHTELKSWIQSHQADLESLGFIERYELYHMVDGAGPERLIVVRDCNAKDSVTICESLTRQAENDASSRVTGTPQRYVVHAYRHSDSPDDIHSFSVLGKNPYYSGGDTEPNTPSGVIGQLMRQNEKMHLLTVQLVEGVSGRLARDVQDERANRIKLEASNAQLMKSIADLRNDNFEKDEVRAIRIAETERKDALLKMVMGLAPLLLTKIVESKSPAAGLLKPPTSPAKPPASEPPASEPPAEPPAEPPTGAPSAAVDGAGFTPREALMAEFFAGLTADQVGGTMAALGTSKTEQLFEIIKAFNN